MTLRLELVVGPQCCGLVGSRGLAAEAEVLIISTGLPAGGWLTGFPTTSQIREILRRFVGI